MPVSIKNEAYLRSVAPKEFPELGMKLIEALREIVQAHNNVEQQGNFNSTGIPQSPPQINGLTVTGQNGHFNIAIHDDNKIYRGIHYWVEHADNPQFTNPITIHMGGSRNYNEYLGNVVRYWRAYSSYGASPPSKPVYHGSAAQPLLVSGGGNAGGPAFQPSQGSGTGAAGEGLSGPGPIPFRSNTGQPPQRKVE